MKKTIRSWNCTNATALEVRTMTEQAKIMLACPKEEALFGDVKCEDGDKVVTVDGLEFSSIYRDGGEFQPVTKEEFNEMCCTEQFYYIEQLSYFYAGYSYLYTEDAKIYDFDSKDVVIEDRFKVDASLYDYLLDLNAESTDLQGRCFVEIEVQSEGIEEVCGSLMLMCRVKEGSTTHTMVGEHVNVLLDEQLDCDSNIIHNEDRFDEDAKIEILAQLRKIVRYELLSYYIDQSGVKVNFLIDKLGINRTTYYRKIENNFNFSRAELTTIKEVLNLTDEQFLKLF